MLPIARAYEHPGAGNVGELDDQLIKLRGASVSKPASRPRVAIAASKSALRWIPGREIAPVIVGISEHGNADLTQIARANGSSAPFPCLVQRRQQHGRQNADDSDDHEQLDQREGPVANFSSCSDTKGFASRVHCLTVHLPPHVLESHRTM